MRRRRRVRIRRITTRMKRITARIRGDDKIIERMRRPRRIEKV